MKSKNPCYVELESVKDLARLVCALERTPLPVFSFSLNGDGVLATPTDLLNERPVVYYAKFPKQGEYLAYRNVGGSEYVSAVEAITNPTFSCSPIIRVEKLPDGMVKSAKVNKSDGYSSIRLKDAASLAKISSYKVFLEEVPLPLFLLRDDSKPVLGTFMGMNDIDGISYFYYVELEQAPSESFLKYSSQRISKPVFTNKLDEHGYVYMKIIRLLKEHPLVMLDD